ncbi:uncharacterized protein LOC121372240 [Gigantopelta aegis]|uniref:uncharacterized protein LOC121372240 n=1 Tax=Gigantopelta aegis TaxID=1735272 RepID=UPI001B889E20|nr:uncharacterized protein LOC121372240 [Gigantopelta aegis]
MLLACVVLVMMLSMSVTEGCTEVGRAFYWSRWDPMGYFDCSLLCGGEGFIKQHRVRARCLSNVGSPIDEYEHRNITCDRPPCGDLCPPGVNKFLPNRWHSQRFYQCANEKAYLMSCPRKTVWAQKLQRCAWPWEVQQ